MILACYLLANDRPLLRYYCACLPLSVHLYTVSSRFFATLWHITLYRTRMCYAHPALRCRSGCNKLSLFAYRLHAFTLPIFYASPTYLYSSWTIIDCDKNVMNLRMSTSSRGYWMVCRPYLPTIFVLHTALLPRAYLAFSLLLLRIMIFSSPA